MATYVPGTQEKDLAKVIMSLQQVGPGLDTATANIATNTTNIASLTSTVSNATIQTAYAELTAFTTGTTAMSGGSDTIPQNTDGTQILTVSITPKLSTSKLMIAATLSATNSSITNMWAALFQDSTAAALTATVIGVGGADVVVPTSFAYQMTSGTTSATTFKLRIGNIAGSSTWAVNGISSARRLGGAQRVTLTIAEIKA